MSGLGEDAFGGVSGGESPILANVIPADRALLAQTAVEFDIMSDSPLSQTALIVSYPDDSQEVVFDGYEFGEHFIPVSDVNVRTVSEDGRVVHFKVLRTGGWQQVPTFKPRAVDAGGNILAEDA